MLLDNHLTLRPIYKGLSIMVRGVVVVVWVVSGLTILYQLFTLYQSFTIYQYYHLYHLLLVLLYAHLLFTNHLTF